MIELDKDLYGPDNHLVEWHRTANTQETDGFQVTKLFFISTNFLPILHTNSGNIPYYCSRNAIDLLKLNSQ